MRDIDEFNFYIEPGSDDLAQRCQADDKETIVQTPGK
jgi:hypothetical protein